MKRLALLLVAASLCLTACGSATGVDAGATVTTTLATPAAPVTPTVAGTAVNLTAFKKVFYGETAGAQYSFNLQGLDSSGNSWTGSYAVIADGPNFQTVSSVPAANALPLYRSRSLATLQQSGGNPFSSSTLKYFLVSDCSISSFYDSSNSAFLPVSQSAPLPDSAKVGDSGTLVSLKQAYTTDPSTIDVSWTLTPDFNGGANLVLTSTLNAPATGVDTEVDSYTLNANGVPTMLTVHIINRHQASAVLNLILTGPADNLVRTIF